MKKVGVVRFPGTNCDRDVWAAVENAGAVPGWLWHQDSFEWKSLAAIVIPGGFSYGDYLRTGAVAARARVMNSVREAAGSGVPVLGICNGFQILCESGLLPGVLVRNETLRFVDEWVSLQVSRQSSSWKLSQDSISLPVAHGEGRFMMAEKELAAVEDRGQVWLRYGKNPNGSINNIAGLMNERGNVVGLMPHPERAVWDWMGGTDGLDFFSWFKD